MFELNFDRLDHYHFNMKDIALTNLFSAWYMLLNLKTSMPNVDLILAKIYFSEYGVNLDGLTDDDIILMAREYEQEIKRFFMRCQIQRCENIIDRFGKVGCDPRLQHNITLPLQCKDFFLELLHLNRAFTLENGHTKEAQCLDSLLSSMIINNTMNVASNRNGELRGTLDRDYNVTPEQFSSYTDIIHNAVCNLYRPLNDLDETYEDWGTKLRRVIDYIKTLVFMATRDVAFDNHRICISNIGLEPDDVIDRNVAFRAPFVALGIHDHLFENATRCMTKAYYDHRVVETIQSAVAPYSSLKLDHAICLFHNTNAKLDTTKMPQSRNSETFKFLCCQEYMAILDEKIRTELLSKCKTAAMQ